MKKVILDGNEIVKPKTFSVVELMRLTPEVTYATYPNGCSHLISEMPTGIKKDWEGDHAACGVDLEDKPGWIEEETPSGKLCSNCARTNEYKQRIKT